MTMMMIIMIVIIMISVIEVSTNMKVVKNC
jgi:hypothetical protein